MSKESDRELLVLAAKAAGMMDELDLVDGLLLYKHSDSAYRSVWDPLDDDGEALRLAVDLHIDIRHFMYENGTMDCLVDRIGRCVREAIGDDPYAATRRAIVGAAAEIERQLKG